MCLDLTNKMSQSNADDDSQTTITLIDFVATSNNEDQSNLDVMHHHHHLLQQFSTILRKQGKMLAFSTNFKLKQTIHWNDFEHKFMASDLNISRSCGCILLCGNNSRMLVFDLKTRKYLQKIEMESVMYRLQIEENYDGYYNDAVLFSENECVFKYDLKHLLKFGKNAIPKGRVVCENESTSSPFIKSKILTELLSLSHTPTTFLELFK